ncbi:MAG: hypothetical protein HOB52_02950 [Euryarchaeota archaeon]|nr:hypothetical protein [Euryarchaeota archaeon]
MGGDNFNKGNGANSILDATIRGNDGNPIIDAIIRGNDNFERIPRELEIQADEVLDIIISQWIENCRMLNLLEQAAGRNLDEIVIDLGKTLSQTILSNKGFNSPATGLFVPKNPNGQTSNFHLDRGHLINLRWALFIVAEGGRSPRSPFSKSTIISTERTTSHFLKRFHDKYLKKSSIQLAAAYAHPDNKENNARAFSLLSFVGATIKTDDGREHVPRRLEYIKYLKIMWPEIDLAEQEHWPVIDYEKD